MIIISKYSNTIEYQLRTTVDPSGIMKLQSSLRDLQTEVLKLHNTNVIDDDSLNRSLDSINKIQTAMKTAYSSKFNMIDTSAFQKSLAQQNTSITQIGNNFNQVGIKGKTAFNDILTTFGKVDTQMNSISKTTDKLFNTMGNTLRWGVMSSAFNGMTDSLREAVDYVKDLDDSLTQIMLVTDYSRDAMNQYAKSANEAAKSLGTTTTAMTNGTLVFAQQGFDLNKSQQLAEYSVKLANASQQDSATTSDQITAYMNAYGLDNDTEKLKQALDSWAEVANISAADVGELAEASQRAASAASTLGVTTDQLNAQIATIESVTREAPEQIGSGLKTLFARFSDLQMGETLDDGVNLGDVTSLLEKVGVQVLDGDGKMRGVGDIMEDLMDVWSSIDSTQKAAVAQTLAGKYQLTRFEALMNRSDLYNEYKTGSENANGTLDVMNEKYINSLQGKLTGLQTSVESVFNSLFESDDFYGFIDALTTAVDLAKELSDSLGGMEPILTGLSAIALKAFSGTAARNISTFIGNRQLQSQKRLNEVYKPQLLKEIGASSESTMDENQKAMYNYGLSNIQNRDVLSTEELNQRNATLEKMKQITNEVAQSEEELNTKMQVTNSLSRLTAQKYGDNKTKLITKNKDGSFNYEQILGDIRQSPDGRSSAVFDQGSINTYAEKISKITDEMVKVKKILGDNLTSVSYMGSGDIKEMDEDFISLSKTIGEVRNRIRNYAQEARMTSEEQRRLSDSLDGTVDAFKQLNNVDVGDEETLEKIKADIQNRIDALQAVIRELQAKDELLINPEKSLPVTSDNVGQMKAQEQKAQDAKYQQGVLRGQMGGEIDDTAQRKQIQSVIDTASAVAQLTFVWQGFQNLGSIWENTDLSDGDKIIQTVTNLAMTLPNLISAYTQLQDAVKNNTFGNLAKQLDTFSKQQKTLSLETQLSSTASETNSIKLAAMSAKYQGLSVAVKGASAAVKIFNAVLEGLTSPAAMVIGILGTMIATLSTAVTATQKANLSKGLENYNDLYSKASVDISSFDAAYQQYKKTGEVSDDLKNSSLELADSLDIVGGKALANAGSFDELANKISDASEQSKKLASEQAQNQLSGYDNAFKSAGWFDTEDIQHKYGGVNGILSELGLDTDTVNVFTNGSNVDKSMSEKIGLITDKISQYQQLISDTENKLSKLDKNSSEYSSTDDTLKGLKDKLNDLQSLASEDEIANSQTILQQQAELAEQTLSKKDWSDSSDFDIKNAILNDEDISNYVDSLGEKQGQEYIKSLVDSIKSSANSSRDAIKSSIDDALSSDLDTDNIKSAQENKSNFYDILDDYKDAYAEKGGFTEDQAAEIIAKDPSYLEYLVKVGDQYQLNERALAEWNERSREQTEAMKEASGESVDLSGSNLAIQQALNTLSEGGNSDIFSAPLESLKELNNQLMSGAISNADFLSNLDNGFDSLTSAIDNATASGKDLKDVLNDTDFSNFAQVLTDELYQGLSQATKQFKSGKMNVTEYSKSISSAANNSMKLAKTTAGLSDEQYETAKTTQNLSKDTKGWATKQKEAAKQINQTAKSLKTLDAAADFNNFVTSNFDDVLKVFDDSGQVLQTATNEMGGIQEQYGTLISGLADSMTTFYSTNKEAAQNVAQQIAATGAMTQQEAYTMLTTGQNLAQSMMTNTQVASAAMQGTMTETESAIGNMASGISGIISDVMAMIGSTSGDIDSEVSETDGDTFQITADGEDAGTVHVPGFKMRIRGKNNSKGGSVKVPKGYAKGQTTVNSAGGVQTTYYNDKGKKLVVNEQAGSQASIDAHAKQLSQGLASLLGANGTSSLKDWAPSGYGVSPSSFAGGPTSSGSGGSGGGGGGGGDSFTPQQKDTIEDEIDLYERVDTILQALENDTDRLKAAQDRLTGSKLAQNLAEQNRLYERQIQLQKEKLNIQNGELGSLQSSLSGYGIQFDSEGYISNYATVHQQLINDVNNLINQFNAAGSEEAQDALSDQIDAAQDKLNKFKTTYQRYDELISGDMRDTIKTIEDLQDAIEDLHIEVFKTQVEALDNIKDIQEALIEFDRAFNRGIELTPYEEAVDNIAKLGKYFDIATDNMDEYYDKLIENSTKAMNTTGVSEAAKNFYAQQIQGYQEAKANQGKETLEQYGTGYLDMSLKNVADIQEQIRQFEETGTSSIFGEDSADLYDVAKTVFDQATGAVKDYWSLIEDLHGNITDMIDDIGDKLDRRKEQYEAITDELEHQADIIELIHGDEAYDQLNYALGAQQHNYQSEIADLQKQVDLWKDMLLSMQEGSEEWNTVSDKIKDATSEINNLIQNSLENLQKQYTNTVNKITKAWGSSAMGTDLDWMSTQWELINRNADYYLDDVNKAYNIQKLQGKYLDLLDGSNDLSIQQKISAQMKEQLSYLRDKTKLSEYDVNYANAQLEILQKQIALEEAQRNKSQMKLRRDTQGNYSYVYTANEGDVSSAQSDLLDAQNNAYNLSKDQMKQTQDDSLSALKDAQSTINDIWNNANLTLEEKKERTQTIIDSLKEYLAGTSEQLSTSEKNIINDFIGMCDALTGENKEGLQDVYDQIVSGNNDAFDQIDTRWQTSITTWLQNLDTFNQNTDKAFDDLVSNAEDYQKKIDDVGELVNKDFNDMSGSVDNLKDKTDELNKSTEEFFNKMKDMSGEVKKGEEAMNYYAEKIQDANNNMRAFQEQVDDLGNKLTAKEQENANLQSQLQKAQSDLQNAYGNNSSGAGGANGGGAGGAANSATAWGIAQSIWTYGAKSGWGNDPIRSSKLTKGYGSDFARQVQSMINAHTRDGSLVNYDSMKYSSYSLLGYDTGGYTGDWASTEDSMDGKGGKLAILHSKEIVLNPDDTENLLAAISMVRQYVNTIGNNFSNLSSYYDQVNKLSSALGDNGVSQEIIINADFPAANSAAEIREALESLNDRALQYAYKTR